MSDAKWLDFTSGTLLLLPESLLSHWGGGEQLLSDEHAGRNAMTLASSLRPTDYSLARDIKPPLGELDVRSGKGLVFILPGHRQTCWYPLSTDRGLIVMRSTENFKDWTHTLEKVDQLPENQWKPSTITAEFTAEPSMLFDAGSSGKNHKKDRTTGDTIVIRFDPGKYMIDTAEVEPDTDIAAVAYRFRRL